MNEILDTYLGSNTSNGKGCALWLFIGAFFVLLGIASLIVFVATKIN